MNWDFLKKRWFTVALLLILLIAIVRKNVHVDESSAPIPAPEKQPELYTDEAVLAKNMSTLNLADGGSSARVQMPKIDDATAIAFLQRFGKVAAAEQQKFGIPASVLLASAYVNSFSGRRACAQDANNYLAIPCTSDWNGPKATFNGRCFRQYATAWESIRGFSLYLQQMDWFAKQKKTAKLDWKPWVNGLARHGISDVAGFEAEMTRIIEAYRLFELDQMAN